MTGKDIKGMTMEDTTAKPPMTPATGSVLEDPDVDSEDAEHVEPAGPEWSETDGGSTSLPEAHEQ